MPVCNTTAGHLTIHADYGAVWILAIVVLCRKQLHAMATLWYSIYLVRFKEPKKRGKFMQVDSGNKITTQEIVQRIITNR